jgi:hypothetical protein
MLDGIDEDVEVRLAMQPSWPFEYSINSVEVILEEKDEEGEDIIPQETVYLVEGEQLGYLPQHVCNELGWK